MTFGGVRGRLYDAQKVARAKWMAAGETWNDDVREDLDEKVIEPLDRKVSELLAAIDQLSSLFSQIRTECEYPS